MTNTVQGTSINSSVSPVVTLNPGDQFFQLPGVALTSTQGLAGAVITGNAPASGPANLKVVIDGTVLGSNIAIVAQDIYLVVGDTGRVQAGGDAIILGGGSFASRL